MGSSTVVKGARVGVGVGIGVGWGAAADSQAVNGFPSSIASIDEG